MNARLSSEVELLREFFTRENLGGIFLASFCLPLLQLTCVYSSTSPQTLDTIVYTHLPLMHVFAYFYLLLDSSHSTA